MEDIVIIGCGPVGLYAATLASLHNLKGVVLEARSSVGGQLSALYPEKDIVDVPGYVRLTAKEYVEKLYAQYDSKENKLPIHLNESVSNLEAIEGGYRLTTVSKNVYETKCILIVSGMGNFSPRKIGLPNEDQFKNIHYAVTSKEVFRDKKVVLLGGGDSALDWDLMLAPLVKDISLVHRRTEFRAQSSTVDEMMKNGTHVYTPYNTTELIGEGDVLKAIKITNNETQEEKVLELDDLIVNFGMAPGKNDFPVEKQGVTIKVGECYMTSLPNVFAIGNTINYPGKVKNITCGLGEAVVAITKIDQIINPGKNIPVHF